MPHELENKAHACWVCVSMHPGTSCGEQRQLTVCVTCFISENTSSRTGQNLQIHKQKGRRLASARRHEENLRNCEGLDCFERLFDQNELSTKHQKIQCPRHIFPIASPTGFHTPASSSRQVPLLGCGLKET